MISNIKIPHHKEISWYFDQNSIIARTLDGYEKRAGQAEMASLVFDSLLNGGHALIEAPCGIGKSYAYIIPAALYAKSANCRLVISTNTKTLQDQLKTSDLPAISSRYGLDFSYKILKGKNNYICLKKLFDIKDNGIPLDLFTDYNMAEKIKFKTDIYLEAAALIERGGIGEFDELRHEVCGDYQFQRLLACTSVECLNVRCQYFKECNYFCAIAAAQKSNLIVVNHSLYLSCLMIESSRELLKSSALRGGDEQEDEAAAGSARQKFQNPIPQHTRVIFDEAHHIADITQSSFSVTLSYNKIYSNLNAITHLLKKNFSKKSKKIIERIAEHKQMIDEQLKLYFNYVAPGLVNELSAKNLEDSGVSAQSNGGSPDYAVSSLARQMLLKPQHIKQIMSNPNAEPLKEAIAKMSDLSSEVSEMLAEKKTALNGGAINSILGEMSALVEFWSDIDSCAEENILWCSLPWQSSSRGNSGAHLSVELISSPLNVAEILKNNLFAVKDSAILTSATLSTENNFKYIKSEIGLNGFKTAEVIFDSPYDLEKQAAFIIAPLVSTPKDRAFNEEASRWIQDIINESEGRALVLFTSKFMMEYVYSEIGIKLSLEGHKIYMQGQKPRGELLKIFKNDTRSCLFALDSFWEGIDVRGESLSTLIITKLPFKVPSHPLNEARDNYLIKNNRNPFYESSVPWTILKLKQGAGRLIRHKTDRGVIAVLDTRLSNTTYGRKIAGALPKYHYLKDIKQIKKFLAENAA